MKNQKKCMQVGDYFVQEIVLKSVEDKSLNKYGRMRRAFLQENRIRHRIRKQYDMAWVRHMNLLREMAEDVVAREVVCT